MHQPPIPHVASTDPEIAGLIEAEARRQVEKVRLIPSENYVSAAVLEATGSVLTNKYSEGYPGKRYYEGQQVIDQVETLAIGSGPKALFGVDHANVQPYSGSPANLAVYLAFLKPGDTVMGMALPMGGHLTHGWPVSATGKWFQRGAVRRPAPRPAASTWTRCATSPSRAAQDHLLRRHRDPADHRLPGLRRDRRRGRRHPGRRHRAHRRA